MRRRRRGDRQDGDNSMTMTVAHRDLLGGERGAVFCDARCHRYKLWRVWSADTQHVLFVMLNPSVADEHRLDRTVRRCVGYAQSWGYGGLYVGNLYSYVTPDPAEMLASANPVGSGNDDSLAEMASEAGMIVVAWGATQEAESGRIERVVDLLRENGPGEIHALKVTKGGQPGHPVRLPKNLSPVVYEHAR